jgi:MoxR-like ATPase
MSREKLLEIEKEMNARFIDRREEIHGLTLGAISKEHVLILGPPGTTKSGLESAYANYMGSTSNFPWLMTQFSTPDEVFGPVDIQAMKSGVYKRITSSKLPEAETAFIDEVFKANSAILNAMLSILQERIYHNNGTPVQVPLHFAVAASNELPEDDDNLQALYDRFLLRFSTGYLQSEDHVSSLLDLNNSAPPTVEPIGMDVLRACSAEALALPLSDEAKSGILLLWSRLRDGGYMFSDRRLKLMTKVMAAESWLNGYTEITPESLIVAEHIMWDRPNQIRDIKSIVRECVDSGVSKAREILESAREALLEVGYKGSGTTKAEKWNLDIHPRREQVYQMLLSLRSVSEQLDELPHKPEIITIRQYVLDAKAALSDRLTDDDVLAGS